MSMDNEFHAAHYDLDAMVDAFEKHVAEHGEPGHGQLIMLSHDIKKDAGNIATGMASVGDAKAIQVGEIAPAQGQANHKPLLTRGLTRIQDAAKSLAVNLADAGKQVRTLVKDKVPGSDTVAKAWDNVLDATSHYTTLGMKRLTGLAQGMDSEDRYAVGFASGHLQSAQDASLVQRKRGIIQTMNMPRMGEYIVQYVLQDAKRLGMIEPCKSVHRGTVLHVVGSEAVLKNAKGQLLALPVTPDFKFKAGDNLVMKDRGDGFYSGKRQLVERGVER
jgi:hypothetical protein